MNGLLPQPDPYHQGVADCLNTIAEKTEALADYAHTAWAGWMIYLFLKSTLNPDGTVTIPEWAVERWTRQAATPYQDLSEEEKESDRDEAKKMLKIIRGKL